MLQKEILLWIPMIVHFCKFPCFCSLFAVSLVRCPFAHTYIYTYWLDHHRIEGSFLYAGRLGMTRAFFAEYRKRIPRRALTAKGDAHALFCGDIFQKRPAYCLAYIVSGTLLHERKRGESLLARLCTFSFLFFSVRLIRTKYVL